MNKLFPTFCIGAWLLGMAACSATTVSTTYSTYSVGGTVTGLQGTLVLTDNSSDTLTVQSDGPFTFLVRLPSTLSYQVNVQSAPAGQTCVIQSGTATGTIDANNITSVAVVCSNHLGDTNYAVGGSVSNLLVGAQMVLAMGEQSITVDASNPNFIFPVSLPAGVNYDVRVASQPDGAVCSVLGGIGTIVDRNIGDVRVACISQGYEIAAVVNGMVAGDTLVLKAPTGAPVTVVGGGTGVDVGVVADGLSFGQAYSVQVVTQPNHATCLVATPGGSIDANTQVTINCIRQSLPFGVWVTGLPMGASIQVTNSGGAPVTVTGSGGGQDSLLLDAYAGYNSHYNVNVITLPPGYDCAATPPTGFVSGLDTMLVPVACVPRTYGLQAQVTGLTNHATVSLSVNQAAPTSLSGGGTFSDTVNLTPVSYGTAYTVSVASSPATQACTITAGGTGTGGISSAAVQVTCGAAQQLFVSVVGLVANGDAITLRNTYGGSSRTDDLQLTNANNNTPASFVVHLPPTTAYAVTALTTPGYQCAFSGTAATGTVAHADITGIIVTCTVAPSFTTGQAATLVLGQGTFAQTQANRSRPAPAANTLNRPEGSPYGAPDGTVLVPDSSNARVLGYYGLPRVSGQPADFVLGQASFATAVQAISPNALTSPQGIFGIGTRVFIGDASRVLVYNSIPHAQVNADAVLGQPNLSTNAPDPRTNQDMCASDQYNALQGGSGAITQGNTLVIADKIDFRALVIDDYTVSATVDAVLGQSGFANCFFVSGGNGAYPGNAAQITSATFDGQRLLLTDQGQSRVLIWDDISTVVTGQYADHVLGQHDFTSGGSGLSSTAFHNPTVVLADHGRLYLADTANHRVLIWNTIPSGGAGVYNALPDVVLGQADANSGSCNRGGAASASTLCSPVGLAVVGTSLLVADRDNHRVLVFKSN